MEASQRGDTARFGAFGQLPESGRGERGVGESAVSDRRGQTQRVGQAVERWPPQAGQQERAERDRVQALVGNSHAEVAHGGLSKEVEVEPHVVADEHIGAGKAQERLHRRAGPGCARHHVLGDTREPPDERRNRPAGIDQAGEGVDHLGAQAAQRGNLDEGLRARAESGRLHVDHDVTHGAQRRGGRRPRRQRPGAIG